MLADRYQVARLTGGQVVRSMTCLKTTPPQVDHFMEDALTIYCPDSSDSSDSLAWGALDSLGWSGSLGWQGSLESRGWEDSWAWGSQGRALRHTSRPHLSDTDQAVEGNAAPAGSCRRR